MAPETSARLFDATASAPPEREVPVVRRGDEQPAAGYVYDTAGRIELAVNVALVTGRPLLIRGKPGTGKSSLAVDVARRLGWRYYAQVVTSRTRARDLLWSYDAVRRLNDASAGSASAADPLSYVTPGVLWWAFSPCSALRRGLAEQQQVKRSIELLADPSPRQAKRAVVLLDEIDKADPDLPNDLLMPLGSLEFVVADVEGGAPVKADEPPLVMITTNEERDLPAAFVRRCVVLALPKATRERVFEVARAHFGPDVDDDMLIQVHAAYARVRRDRMPDAHEPSVAEFLDAVAAVVALPADVDRAERWEQIVEFTLAKPIIE